MKQFHIELDEVVCQWLAQIAEITGQPIEAVISNVVYQQVASLEDIVTKRFTYQEQ